MPNFGLLNIGQQQKPNVQVMGNQQPNNLQGLQSLLPLIQKLIPQQQVPVANPGQGLLQGSVPTAANPIQTPAIAPTGTGSKVLDVLKGFEGFAPRAMWDVNAYRGGYGSDTTTLADGTVVKIKPGMSIKQEDADRDLMRRVQEFTTKAVGQVGEDIWNSLPEAARTALTSLTYNYGSLPKKVVAAAKQNDLQGLSDAVRGLESDNKGINKTRRHKEADMILIPDEQWIPTGVRG